MALISDFVREQALPLPDRWTQLKEAPEANAMASCEERFIVGCAGRRAYKTETWKRRIFLRDDPKWKGILHCPFSNGRYVLAAPTNAQAMRLFWEDAIALSPKWSIRRIWRGEQRIEFVNNANLWIAGLDVPERIEGDPLHGIVMDEMAKMRHDAWAMSVRPALDTDGQEGWAAFIGKPLLGSLKWKELCDAAMHGIKDWGYFNWPSSRVLEPNVIADAKRDLDTLTFDQEYGGKWVMPVGAAYYPFERDVHASIHEAPVYDPDKPVSFCFDFNKAPGIAAVAQDFIYKGVSSIMAPTYSGYVDEVWIAQNSTTEKVCDTLIERYASVHRSRVLVYADATGGSGGSAKVAGSDIDLIKKKLGPVFGSRIEYRIPSHNPRERVRVNAVNSRLRSADGLVHLRIHPIKCPWLVKDFENTQTKDDGSGALVKIQGGPWTHLTDGVGYREAEEFPIEEEYSFVSAK